MPSALDGMITAALDQMTGPGGPFAVGVHDAGGITLPIITNAPATLPDYITACCEKHGDATFLVDGEERLSFTDVHRLSVEVAAALLAVHGVKKGDRIGIAMRNAPAWIISYIAALMAGGTAVLLNGWWQGPELAAGIADAGCSLVIADGPRVKRLAEHGGAGAATLICLDLNQSTKASLAPLVTGLADSGTVAMPSLSGDDVATILFTSGSTGQSKGAWSTHRAVVQATYSYIIQTLTVVHILTAAGNAPVGQPSTLLNLPLFHVTGEVPVFLQSFALGRKLVLMPKWDAEEAMRLIEREKVTYFVGVPLMSYEMMIHPNRARYDLSSCKSFAAGGAPRPRDHVRRLSQEMGGGQPLLGYGLTETNAVGCGILNDNYLAKPDSTGCATLPLVDLAILSDDGQPVPQGAVGEVSIRSVCNFSGYWNNDEATAAAMTPDGRFRTGDLGYLDEDGYLFIVDRKKDIIIRGGENVSCPEVEAAIYAHPAIAECSVFGLPDERFGEIVGAVVRYKPGEEQDEATLTAFLKDNLAAFKVPAKLWSVTDPLPVLGTGKLDRVNIRKTYRESYAAVG